MLLARGADVNAMDPFRSAPLHEACMNGAFGREIIPLLCRAGARTDEVDAIGRTPLNIALNACGAMAKALDPFLDPNSRAQSSNVSDVDPLGCIRASQKYGCLPGVDFTLMWTVENRGSHINGWSCLSATSVEMDCGEFDCFVALMQSDDVKLWKWASSEQLMQRHPRTGKHIFHLLCKTSALSTKGKLAVLADLKRHRRNPLTPDFQGKLPVSKAADGKLQQALLEYMSWRPDRFVMEWFGPAFQRRAFALLLVCNRLRAQHKRLSALGADVKLLLVKYQSRTEHLYA